MELEYYYDREAPRVMTKQELRGLYNWEPKDFRNKVNKAPDVFAELEAAGYDKDCKKLTLKQVHIIFSLCGHPEEQKEEKKKK